MNQKKLEIDDDSNVEKVPRHNTIIHFIKSNKYPILLAVCFFLICSYVSFFHHHYWIEYDGIYYFHAGEQILNGDGKDVKIANAPVGGPILYAVLNSLLNDGFLTTKIISILSGTGIVFVSYYIIRNIFNSKVAMVGQLLLAFNPRLHFLSIFALNELLPIFLLSISLYFITKKHLNVSHLIIVGSILGISSMIRFQTIIVVIAIIIFLLIRNRKIRNNLFHSTLVIIFFMITFSPLIVYNYSTHKTLLDNDPNFYMLSEAKYQTPQWHDKMEKIITSGENTSGIFLDFNLFLKNYCYNLLYYNPNLLFNFHAIKNNISIIPIIPFLGIIPVLGGLFYSLKAKLNKTNLSILFGTAAITAVFVFLLGDFKTHFFAIIIIPVLVFGIIHIRKIEKNLLPLLILSVVFFVMVSVGPLLRADELFAMWIVIPTLSALFIIETLPKMYLKFRKRSSTSESGIKNHSKIIILLIIIILLANVGTSYKYLEIHIYNEPYIGIKDEISKLFNKNILPEYGTEIKQIGDMLSKQPDIKNSYVMSEYVSYAYYANSKFVYTKFQEGVKGDSLNKFISRTNWSDFDTYFSNINSYPNDRYNIHKPIPDYLIYEPLRPNQIDPRHINTGQYSDLEILDDPKNPAIPSNFELLYQSNNTGIMVYKINHEK